MKNSSLLNTCCGIVVASIAWAMSVSTVEAVVATSTFSSTIQVQGEVEGIEFDDWAGIPIALSDPEDAIFGTDIQDIQIANNDDHIFIRATLYNTEPTDMQNMFLAFDLDQDIATGFDVNGMGIGSDIGYQADFPFQQGTGEEFNTGVEGVVEFGGDFIGLGLIFPFINAPDPFLGTQIEWSIPIDLAIGPDGPGTPLFTSNTFDFSVYYSGLFVDSLDEVITYTLAENPNPGTPGDFDGDDDVDGADFLAWQRDSATLGAAGLSDWQANYGVSDSLQAGITGVPEPSSIFLVSLGLLSALALQRQRL